MVQCVAVSEVVNEDELVLLLGELDLRCVSCNLLQCVAMCCSARSGDRG